MHVSGKPFSKNKIVGLVVENNGRLQVDPCDKKKRTGFYDLTGDLKGVNAGDVVVVEECVSAAGTSLQVKMMRVLGHKTSPGILSLISLAEVGLSETFSQAALNAATAMTVPDLQGREDLRAIPLVTIDGADARDFDDAVFAESTADGGFHLIVAIADVSWYVQPGSDLDKEAYARGNSTYFPDRVLPMLPEFLSNGLCSLKPHEDRACMAFHLWIDRDGVLTGHKVARGLMNSAARLTYQQVQSAKDGQQDAVTGPLMKTVINPLYAAYAVLRQAREKRGTMDLDLPEGKISVSHGKTVGVKTTARMDSQRLIEEFMILANVAAATALESKGAACVYRVHSTPPSARKVEALRALISECGFSLPAGEIKSAAAFKDVIQKAAQTTHGDTIIKAILRVQAKATYDTQNAGHFGLALKRYAHFTSPIRRYADLLVHRSLADAFNMGQGALDSTQKTHLPDMAKHITETEVRSAKAERSAHDRFSAAFFAAHIGQDFKGRIISATNAGLFVKLANAGTDGLLPMHGLPKDYYVLDKDHGTLTGRNHGRVYRVGEPITVRLKKADALKGSILLAAANDNGMTSRLNKKTGPRPRRQNRKKDGHHPAS